MIFMMIFWILIIASLVFLINWLIRSAGRDKAHDSINSHAFEILKEHYALGRLKNPNLKI